MEGETAAAMRHRGDAVADDVPSEEFDESSGSIVGLPADAPAPRVEDAGVGSFPGEDRRAEAAAAVGPAATQEDRTVVLSRRIEALFRESPRHHRQRSRGSEIAVEDRLVFCEFLRGHTCYDLLPLSSKVIVFDTALQVKKAFYAMLQNDIRSAPLWNSATQSVVGMLTVTDFINILSWLRRTCRHYHYNPGETMGIALQDHQIQTWRDMDLSRTLPEGSPSRPLKQVISVLPTQSLLEAASLLIGNRIHRIPLIDRKPPAPTSMRPPPVAPRSRPTATSSDVLGAPVFTGEPMSITPSSLASVMDTDLPPTVAEPEPPADLESVVAVITQFKILRFIACNFQARPALLRKSISDMGIGTFQNLATARLDTPLIQVLDIFAQRRISCVPVVDEHGVVLDVYEKYDVTYLARDGAYDDLNMPLREALRHRMEGVPRRERACGRQDVFEGVHTCTDDETLASLFKTIERSSFHRLVIVDEANRLKGIVSISDILGFLLL